MGLSLWVLYIEMMTIGETSYEFDFVEYSNCRTPFKNVPELVIELSGIRRCLHTNHRLTFQQP